jgi:predicted N-acetyltransferase YhbS
VNIRPETEADYDAVAEVTAAAFGKQDEARLVEAIRSSEEYVPELALVAEENGRIVGHVMHSYSTLVAQTAAWATWP